MAIINQSYKRDVGRCWGPVYFPGEEYSFYINFDTPISDLSFSDMRLQIRKSVDQSVVHQFANGTLVKDQINGYYYNIYAVFVMPVLPFGQYEFAIKDIVSNTVKAKTNTIFIEEEDVVVNTALLQFRHSTTLYSVRYEELPDFLQIFRLPLIQTNFDIQTERRQYRNTSNRKLRNLKNYKDELVTIESHLFDETGHKAIAAAYDHDFITLDGNQVTPKDVYAIEPNKYSVYSKGSINVIVDDTSGLSVSPTGISNVPGEFSEEFN